MKLKVEIEFECPEPINGDRNDYFFGQLQQIICQLYPGNFSIKQKELLLIK